MTTNTMSAAVATLLADRSMASLHRSLESSYGDPARAVAMDRFYARFVGAGDLAFDVGSHVGDRIASFRRLGARVVAVEPQPACVRAIQALYQDDDQTTVVAAACGATPEPVTMHLNSANPTVSTASADFVRAADGADGWAGQVWDGRIEVPGTTLDALITAHGVPAFVKIDVEGFEDAVLAGLTHPLPALSFEFTTIARQVAGRCLDRLTALGPYTFNVALGDSRSFALARWVPAAELAAYLRGLPHAANSGDVYCLTRARPVGG